jgi:VCBS repeat-containing protein
MRSNCITFRIGGWGDDDLLGSSGRDVILGNKGADFLDGGAGSDLIHGGRGNDAANYTMAQNRKAHDVYDGGKGFDTLRLTFTQAEFQLASVQKDIAAFEAFLHRKANPWTDCGRTFEFRSFNLDVRDFEALEIVILGAPNSAPVALEDSYVLDEDTVLLVAGPGVAANDTDAQGSALSVALVAGPSHGTLVLNANGSFSYTPLENFNGTDSFTYKANDSALDSNVVTVTLAVAPVNDAPVAFDDTLAEHAIAPTIRVAVIGGSSGSSVAAAAQLDDSTAFHIDADALAATLFTTQAEWADLLELYDVVVLGDGGFQMDYNAQMPLFPALRGFAEAGGGVVTTGTYAFILPLLSSDADAITPIAPQPFDVALGGETITLLDTPHPITDGLDSYQINAAAHEVAGGIDAGATVLATGVGAMGGTGEPAPALVVGAAGAGRTAYFGSLQMANEGAYAPDREAGGTVDQIFERVVAWAAGAREVLAATDEDTALFIDPAVLLANDCDLDNDALSIGGVSASSARGASVLIDDDGRIVYDPTAVLQYLQAGQVVADSFDYTVIDGNGGVDVGRVSLTVAGQSDASSIL